MTALAFDIRWLEVVEFAELADPGRIEVENIEAADEAGQIDMRLQFPSLRVAP